MSTDKLKVSVIGLGKMGSALATAFVHSEQIEIVVFNRDKSKYSRFEKGKVVVAVKAKDAIEASSIIVVCVSDYQAVNSIFFNDDVISVLNDKIIVQLSTGTPKDAEDFANWVENNGASYIDGRIFAWTNQIGKPEATIMVSGKENVYAKVANTLKILAGNLVYTGIDFKKPATLFSATLSYLAGHWIGLSYGALICEKEGVDVIAFGEMLSEMAPFIGIESKYLTEVVANNNFSNAESTIKIAGTDIERLVRHTNESGISDEFPKFASSIFQKTIDAGFGEEEHCALIKVMR